MSYRNAAQEIAHNADKVELLALQKSIASMDEGLVNQDISGESEVRIQAEENPQQEEQWSKSDRYYDSQQGGIMNELQTRSELLGDLYPFDFRQSSLLYTQSTPADSNVYETFLLVSITTKRQGRDWLNLVNSFEKLSALVIEKYFQCSETWWTGANSNSGLQSIIQQIHVKTGELEWIPDSNFSDSSGKVGEAGLDFINYRNLIDHRPGGLFFYGQSACGGEWLAKTAHDLRPNRLRNIFRQPYANPVNIFTIPYLITSNHENMLKAASNISGLVFDRARLTCLLSEMLDHTTVKDEVSNIYDLARICN